MTESMEPLLGRLTESRHGFWGAVAGQAR